MQVPLNLDVQTLMKLTFVKHHEDFHPTQKKINKNYLKAIFDKKKNSIY